MVFGFALFVHSMLIFAFRPAIVYYVKCLYYDGDIKLGEIFSFLIYFVIFVLNWPKDEDDHKSALLQAQDKLF